MKFNVNEYVKVKLTEIGKAELRKQNDELRAVVKSLRPYSEPEEDDLKWNTKSGHLNRGDIITS